MDVARILVRGDNIFGVGLMGGPGGRAHEYGEFSKIFKEFFKKIAKMH